MKNSYFISHGSPMTIIEKDSGFHKSIKFLKEDLDKSKGIIVISAHWLEEESIITTNTNPKIIYDFYGFPEELYNLKPELSGNEKLGKEISKKLEISFDNERGFDHGTWGVLQIAKINSNMPVFQLSVNTKLSLEEQYKFGKSLIQLRKEGYTIIGSGGLVHNLREMKFDNMVRPWAKEFQDKISKEILSKNNEVLLNPQKIKNHELAIPEYSHYYPLAYILGSILQSEKIEIICDEIQLGTMSMLCFKTKQN